jgi:hypothetical protein
MNCKGKAVSSIVLPFVLLPFYPGSRRDLRASVAAKTAGLTLKIGYG